MLSAAEEITAAERTISELGEELTQLLGQLGPDVAACKEQINARLTQRDREKQTARAEHAARLDTQQAQLEASVRERITRAMASARAMIEQTGALAPIVPVGTLEESALCPALSLKPLGRVGTIISEQYDELQPVPAFVPLINSDHLVLQAPGDTAALKGLLTGLVAQAYLSAPAGQLVVTVFNPRLTDSLSGFQAAGAVEAKVLVNLHPSQEALEKALADHVAQMLAVESSMAGQYANLGDLVAATGQHEHQYRLLVVLDAPKQFSPRAISDLERILDRGSSRGISVVLHHDPAEAIPRELEGAARLFSGRPTMRHEGGDTWQTTIAGVPLQVASPPAVPIEAQQRLMTRITDAAKTGSLPKVSFGELVVRAKESSRDGLGMVLGRKGNQRTQLTIGDTVSNLHNVLVGGAVGTGKTNLLKVMIYSLAARYTPAELQFFLLDFKEGVEFQQFLESSAGGGLPHAAVVSIESDVQFGLATLQHFVEEMRRRSALFKAAGATNLASYRRLTQEVMSRWVLVADEFQVLLEGETNVLATELMETVVRKGRAFGLHVVLASQTLSGIRFSGGKDDAIFAQFPARVVLKMPANESQIFLKTGNDAAATQLRYRGQAVLNTNNGEPEDNQIFVVGYADDQTLLKLQDGLAKDESADGAHRPRVYRGRDPIAIAELLAVVDRPLASGGALPAWFGQECTVVPAVASAMLGRTTGSNLLVLGSDIATSVATVQFATLSLVAAAAEPVRVLLFEALLPHHRAGVVLDDWLETLTRIGGEVTIFGADDHQAMAEQMARADGSKPTVAVLLGAENSDFADSAEEHDWSDRIRDWPRRGLHVVGQWADVRAIPGNSYDLATDFQTMVFANAALNVVEQATGLGRYSIPANVAGRVLAYASHRAQEGLRLVTAVRPIRKEDLDACARWM